MPTPEGLPLRTSVSRQQDNLGPRCDIARTALLSPPDRAQRSGPAAEASSAASGQTSAIAQASVQGAQPSSSSARLTAIEGFGAAMRSGRAAVATVRRLADEVSRLEAELARSSEKKQRPLAGDEGARRKDEREGITGRLQDNVERAKSRQAALGNQCERAHEGLKRLDTQIEQKTAQLEQLRRRLDGITSAAPQPIGAASRAPSVTASKDIEARIAALETKLNQLRSSRNEAAKEAGLAENRQQLRALSTQSLRGIATLTMTGLPDEEGQQLISNIKQWLKPRHVRAARGGSFESAKDAAFKHLQQSAEDPDKALDALQTFLSMTRRLPLKALHEFIEHAVADGVMRFLYAEDATRNLSTSIFARLGERSQANATRFTVGQIRRALDRVIGDSSAFLASNATRFSYGGETFNRSQVSRAHEQCEGLRSAFEAHMDAFVATFESVRSRYVKGLMQVDDVEKMGLSVAPGLAGYYDKEIANLQAEIGRQRKALREVRSSAAQASTAQDAPVPGGGIDQIEIRIRQLEGEILRCNQDRRSELERFTDLSARHAVSQEEVDASVQQLRAHNVALQALYETRLQEKQQRNEQDVQAVQTRQDFDDLWKRVVKEPALTQLVVPGALWRAANVHVGQSSEQMRARVADPATTITRTGTYPSRSSLLRVVADVASHELDTRRALLAQTREDFDKLTEGDTGEPGGLCNHGRQVGEGVRQGALGLQEARTGTTQYALKWIQGQGPRISHLHPWISPY